MVRNRRNNAGTNHAQWASSYCPDLRAGGDLAEVEVCATLLPAGEVLDRLVVRGQ